MATSLLVRRLSRLILVPKCFTRISSTAYYFNIIHNMYTPAFVANIVYDFVSDIL